MVTHDIKNHKFKIESLTGILFDPDVVSAFLNVVFHNLKIG